MTDQKQVETIAKGLEKSFGVLKSVLANNHGSFRGTAEAVLAEAQGLRITDSTNPTKLPKFHLNSLNNDARALNNALTRINQLFGKLKSENKEVYNRLWKASAQMRNLAQSRITILREVEGLAIELQKTGNHNRLSGMTRVIMTAGRDMKGLVSSQLTNMNVKLLPPAIARDFQGLMARVRSLPLNAGLAAGQVTAAMATFKAALDSAVTRSVIMEFFGVFGRSLLNVLRAVPIIIIVPPEYYQGPDDRPKII